MDHSRLSRHISDLGEAGNNEDHAATQPLVTTPERDLFHNAYPHSDDFLGLQDSYLVNNVSDKYIVSQASARTDKIIRISTTTSLRAMKSRKIT